MMPPQGVHRMPLHEDIRFVSVSVLILGASLLATVRLPAPAAAGGARHALPRALRAKMSEPLRRYDRPDEAQELYRMKRAPLGQRAVPAERYLTALAKMRTMLQHSTPRQAMLPSRAALAGRR